MNESHLTTFNTSAIVMLTALLSYIPGSALAATIFAPTDGNINFLLSSNLQNGTLAMFDDSDQSYLGTFIDIPLASTVGIFGPVNGSNDYLATNGLGDIPLTLTGNNHFILGLYLNGLWLSDTTVFDQDANRISPKGKIIGILIM